VQVAERSPGHSGQSVVSEDAETKEQQSQSADVFVSSRKLDAKLAE
jgi:hypothetical protein